MTTALEGDHRAVSRPQLWRVSDRGALAALRSSRRRVRRGPLTVTWLAPTAAAATEPPRAAFAIGRRAGNAVVRNRIRRRLRAALRHLLVQGRLPAGSYLLSGQPELAQIPWSELVNALDDVIVAVTAETAS